ncbi:MAG: hypothetical protein ACD_51C00342G0002 [uncultured bacterium]|nr:MAG: hypothetical protein ACD_51C00342G0002 [uncultured bacterium]
MKKPISVAVTQYQVPATSEKMLAKINSLMSKINQEVDLVLLPETAYPTLEEVKNGLHAFQKLSKLAKKYRKYLAGAAYRRDKKGRLRITAYLFDRKGELVLEQNKMCLPPVDIEQGIESDNIFRTVDTEFGRLAMLSCKDAFYRYNNDLFQELRKAGVDLMLIPTWSLKVNQRSISLVREGVIAECNWSDIYVCLSGNVGNEIVNRIGKKLKAFGHAMIICPLRGVLKEGSEDREEILYETLEPKYLREIREYDKVWQPDERLEFRMEEP